MEIIGTGVNLFYIKHIYFKQSIRTKILNINLVNT